MAAEFKISRLRFNYLGEWAEDTFYNRDAIVTYEGKLYVCLEPHTSDNTEDAFYLALNYITPQGAPTPYWQIVVNTRKWAGEWQPNTYYSLDNIVSYGGSVYFCNEQHNSGSSFNSAKFDIYATTDGNWNNTWQTNFSYGLGDVVRYGGILYKCNTNHVSAATTTLGLEDDQSYWTELFIGVEYKGTWSSSGFRYKKNDLVKYGADIWIAESGHTSSLEFDQDLWDLWTPGQDYADTYSSSVIYQIGDVITYGGYTYTSLIANNEANTPTTTPSAWELLTEGYSFENNWNSSANYRVGNVVRRGGNIFVAVQDNTNQDPTNLLVSKTYQAPVTVPGNTYNDTTDFTVVGTSPTGFTVATVTNFANTPWITFITQYGSGGSTMTVTVNGVPTSFTIAAITPQPAAGPQGGFTLTFVEPFNPAGSISNFTTPSYTPPVTTTITLSNTTGLVPGLILTGAGFTLGQSIVQVLNGTDILVDQIPDNFPEDGQSINFVGINYVYWNLTVPGSNWRSIWEAEIAYTVGDLVLLTNTTYKCVQTHTSSLLAGDRPDLDHDYIYWIPYLLHARRNALTNQGDIKTIANDSVAVVEIGDQYQVLQASNATGEILPEWKKILVTPKVYYVSESGVDAEGYGDTWDRPWRTIKYAAEQVNAGTEYQGIKACLEANKKFLTTEMYQWMLYQKQYSVAPFTPSSQFDPAKTVRDASYIIDGIVYDLSRGGNAQTVINARAFFNAEGTGGYINSNVAAQMPYFVAALNRLKVLMLNYVLIGNAPPIIYQETNGVTPGDIIELQTGFDVGFITPVEELIDIVIDALTNATTDNIPPPNKSIASTIMVKTGTYEEELPIIVPEYCAIVGDELRGVTVTPKIVINTFTERSFAGTTIPSTTTISGTVDHSEWSFSTNGSVTLTATGLPYHSYGNTADPNTPDEIGIDKTFPWRGGTNIGAEDKIATDSGTIGYWINGVSIGSPNAGTDVPDGYISVSGFNYNKSAYSAFALGYSWGADEAGGFSNADGTYQYTDFSFDLSWVSGDGFVSGPHNTGSEEVTQIPYLAGTLVNSNGHSKIIGISLDGYPIYGPFGYDDPLDPLSGVRVMQSGYTLKNSNYRVGTAASNLTEYPMGIFVQDYDFTDAGDLDEHNGRYCITPEYPNGTYAYFVTVDDATLFPAYPYVIGNTYYATPAAEAPDTTTEGNGGGFAPLGLGTIFTGGYFTCYSTQNMSANEPIQFVSTSSFITNLSGFETSAITAGETYYVVGDSLTSTTFQVSVVPDGSPIGLSGGTGFMQIIGGDATKDMFRLRNGTGLRNLTVKGLLGTLTPVNEYLTARPTGGSYCAFDPGTGPDDTVGWIKNRSPYLQNVTLFGAGCAAMKVDGTLHNGGNKSMTANDFTCVLSDGIGAWVTGNESKAELISVFTYYNYVGYFAEDGGRIRAANGNCSYGEFGAVAEGYDLLEDPITATVDNRTFQATASVQQAFGIEASLLKLQYSNAGIEYIQTVTNLLNYSNNFLGTGWTTDGNINLAKNLLSPSEQNDGWTLTGTTSNTDSSYIYKEVTIPPQGAVYTNLAGSNISGSGSGATFDVTVNATSYSVIVSLSGSGGTGYVLGNQITIYGSQVGGLDGTNDITLTVTSLVGSTIITVSAAGTVPAGSALRYTFSIHAKKATSNVFDLYAIFSGTSTRTSYVTWNFNTQTLTAGSNGDGGLTPALAYRGVDYLNDGWYRIWFSVYDTNALNDTVQLRIYPRGRLGTAGSTSFYGAQVEIGSSPRFYLSTTTGLYDAYADYIITGAGINAQLVADETRSNSVYQSRITDPGSGAGGTGYLTASNNAQGGNDSYIILAQADINTAANYNGMRIFINSGTGAGQYGFISNYDEPSKVAYVLKESVTPLTIASASTVDDSFSLNEITEDISTLYVDQPVQFIPTYYSTSVENTSEESYSIISVVGGTVNTMAIADTSVLYYNMPIKFSGTIPETVGVIANFTYFVQEIVDEFYFKITSTSFGPVLPLSSTTPTGMNIDIPSNTSYLKVTSTSGMAPNMPIQFTGTALGGITLGQIYYINDIIDSTRLAISSILLEPTVTATDSSTNRLTVSATGNLTPLSPITFSEPTIGGVQPDTKYYISKITSGTSFRIAETILTVDVTNTAFGTNLITCENTSGFVADNPIKFTGNGFGGLVAEQTYYILAVNDSTTFTVASSVGGSSVTLQTAVGFMTARTCPSEFEVVSDAGSMLGKTTNAKTTLARGSGAIMNAVFSTPVFGGVSQGTTYYIKTITPGAPNKIQVSASPGGAAVNLVTGTGTMKIGEVGWDHVNLGTESASVFDTTTLYFIEPRLTYSEPTFVQESTTLPTAGVGTTYVAIAYGDNYWIAVPDGNTTIAGSPNGSTWQTFTLPITSPQTWSDICYGNTAWVLIAEGTDKVLYSFSKGQSWKTGTMPSSSSWSSVAYSNGVFVAVASGTSNAAYSTNYGASWTASTLPGAATDWTNVAAGGGKFVVLGNNSTRALVSDDGGATWSENVLPVAATWTKVAYGNGRFVATSNTAGTPVYSFDGITWYVSPYSISADVLAYGNGVFIALSSGASSGYQSEDGKVWKKKSTSIVSYADAAFGFTPQHPGRFVTCAGSASGTTIITGSRTKGRPIVENGIVTAVTEFETGGGYLATPVVTLFDPNVTLAASITPRLGNGVLSAPTFINPGEGYNTSSTTITINGGGFSDEYQTGLSLRVSNLTQLPRPGDDLVITGDSTIYKVTNATILNGTTAPNLTAAIELSPDVSVALSPDHNTALIIREKYSQCRLTNHDFLNIGYGDERESGYPNPVPVVTTLQSQNQTIENHFGRVFYTSTDQDGNFKTGNLFGVEQATGIVTLSASQFGLSGLETLTLGGIAVGGSSVVITQFSVDATFVANSDAILPTQRAVKSYLTARLSQGGSNTFTGNTTAGSVTIGGPNVIGSTIPVGVPGHGVYMLNRVTFDGLETGMVDGDMPAFNFFVRGKGLERLVDPSRIIR